MPTTADPPVCTACNRPIDHAGHARWYAWDDQVRCVPCNEAESPMGQLRAERDRLDAFVADVRAERDVIEAERDRARAERDRLRATLEWVLAAHRGALSQSHDCLFCQRLCAALAPQPTTTQEE